MRWLHPQTVDDRGRAAEPLKLNAAAYRDDPDLSATVARIHESIWNTGRLFSIRRTLPVLLAIAFIMAAALLAKKYMAGLPGWAPMVFAWSAVFVIMRAMMVLSRRKHARRIVESLLRIGRCPGCGYDLRAATPEADGACVCPECGAAWRQERIGHAPVARVDLPVRPDMPGDSTPILRTYLRFVRRTPTIVDDRDRSVARVGLDLPGLDEQVGPEGARALRRSVAGATAVRRFGCAIPIALVGLMVVGGSVTMFIRSGLAFPSAFSLLFALWMTVVYSAICWRMVTGRLATSSKPIVNVLRRAGVCPSCAAHIGPLSPDADGCTTCPRCSSAWKLAMMPVPAPMAAPPTAPPQDSTRNTTMV